MNRGMSAPALWLLGHLAHRNEPLAGDLVEQFRDRRGQPDATPALVAPPGAPQQLRRHDGRDLTAGTANRNRHAKLPQ